MDKVNIIQTFFNEVFITTPNKFNISAGKPLTKFSIVNAALKLLSLNINKLSHEDLNFLLNTPFIKGAETEKNRRAKFFNQIIATNQKLFSITLTYRNHVDHIGTRASYCDTHPISGTQPRTAT